MKKIYKISVVLVLGIQLLVNPTAKILALGDTEKSSVNSDRQNSESTSSDTYKPVEIKEANKESIKAEGAETSGNEVSEESPLIEPEPEPEPESKPIPTATNETNEGSPEPEPVTTDASTKDTTENIAARAANIASGTVGTSPWYLTSDGVLHIGAGELVNTTNSDSPWGAWNEKIISVVLDGPVKAAPISESLFSSFYNVVSFENLNYLDTSNVTNMRAMFFRAESLKSLDLSSFNMSNVTNTNNMFALNRSLENLNTAGWDTSKIQNMDTMFSATNFKELNLEHWNTSSVTSMRDMFAGNKSLEKLSVSTWDTRNVTMMSSFLEQASSLKTLDLSGWTTSSSTNVVAMFSSTDSLWKITLPSTFNNLYITGLASLDPNRTDYTDKWQSVGNGTDTQPNGQYVLTGRELTETFKGATMADTYVWQPKAPVMGQVNVRYVAQGGNAVAPTKVISGIEGTPYDVSTPDYKLVIPGYTLDESILPTNAIGLLTSSVSYQDVVYVYNQPAADVTVRYVDQAGNELAPSKTISGVVDDSYDTTTADYKKTIAGYTLDESQLPSNKTGTLGVNPQTVNYVYKKKTIPSGGVKVRYVDQQGNELAPSKAVEGNVGTPYDVTTSDYRLVLPGYELDQNQVLLNGTGIFSEDTQTVSYVYKQIIEADPALNVTVRYVDEDGNEIRLNKTISGYVGDPFDATTSDYKLAVPGYTLDETQLPSNGTGTLSGNYQTVTYKYTKNPLIAADVTVRYVDQSGNELNPSKTISGNIGDAYDATTSTYKLTIAGYTLNASLLPTNGTGTLSANAQTVTYIYTKNVVTAADVTVRYVDQSGNEITPSKAISGNIGDAYDVTTSTYKLTIAGYTLNASLLPTNGTGTLSANAQTVTYIYTKNVVTAADVTVRYVDQSGNEITPSKAISGNIEDAYDATTSTYKLTIAGYTLNTNLLPTNGTGTLSANAQTVTYIYTKNVVTAADVTVRYVDQDGNEVAPKKAISGNISDAYDATTSDYKLTIAGYTLNASLLPTNGTGTLSSTQQTVTYIYKKNSVAAGSVTVRYVDEMGNVVATNKTITGNVGTAYDATTPDYTPLIAGYLLDTTQLPSNGTGMLSTESQTVTYVYKKEIRLLAHVIVRYVDQQGLEIAPSKVLDGNIGTPYDVSTPDYQLVINGYSFNQNQVVNTTGIFSTDSQTVTYVYTKNPVAAADVTIRYVDQAGTEVAPSKTISGDVGNAYDASTPTYKAVIAGYTLVESQLPTNATGVLRVEPQTVTYVFSKNPLAAAGVIVRYVDQDGVEVAPSKSISGNIGDAYDTTTSEYQLTIAGYESDTAKLPTNGTGTLTTIAQTVTYVYVKKAVPAAAITIRYVNQSGKELVSSKTLNGNLGDAYDATTSKYRVRIVGYTLNANLLPTNGTGTFSADAQTITYIFVKNSVKSNPTNGSNPSSTNGGKPTVNSSSTKGGTSPIIRGLDSVKRGNSSTNPIKKTYPQLGDNATMGMIQTVVGAFILFGLLPLLLIMKKRKKN